MCARNQPRITRYTQSIASREAQRVGPFHNDAAAFLASCSLNEVLWNFAISHSFAPCKKDQSHLILFVGHDRAEYFANLLLMEEYFH